MFVISLQSYELIAYVVPLLPENLMKTFEFLPGKFASFGSNAYLCILKQLIQSIHFIGLTKQFMKKILYFVLAAVLFSAMSLFSACTTNSDNPVVEPVIPVKQHEA